MSTPSTWIICPTDSTACTDSIIGTTRTCSLASSACSTTHSPQAVALGSYATAPFRGVTAEGNGPTELILGFDPGDNDAIRPDVEGPLEEPSIQVGNTDHGDCVAADRSSKVLDDFAPVEVTVLGVDHHPIESESHRHFGHARGFQRNPQAEDRLTGGQLLPQPLNGECIHTSAGIPVRKVIGTTGSALTV